MADEKELVFDYDALIYKCGFATEHRQIEVTHIPSGRKRHYKNITEFWGRKKNEIEGKLGEINQARIEKGKSPFSKDEFEYSTIRYSEPIENVLHTVKHSIKNICEALGTDNYIGYIGKGDSFRLERSTILKYKGNREEALRPLMKDEITEYLVKHHNAKIVTGLEADDWCIIRAYKNPNKIVVAVDKDALGCAVNVYNPDHPEWGVINGDCFGELQLIEKENTSGIKKEVKGYGRKFFYYQVAYGDDVDYYRSNCASETSWGPVSAYNALDSTQNDREALQALVSIYQHLYPSPTKIIGWNGEEIAVDWKYVFNEVWDLARMRRHEHDIVVGTDVLKKFKLL